MKKTMRPFAALAAMLLVLFVSLSGCAKEEKSNSSALPTPPELLYVYDEPDILSAAVEHEIVSQNNALFALSGAEIAVVCVHTTGYTDIADYAHTLFNTWGIGSAERNNGILILLSVGEDDYWVLQGAGLEDILPSGLLKTMVDEHLEPYFAARAYEDGVFVLFSILRAHLEDAYSIDLNTWDGAPGAFTNTQSGEAPADDYDDTSALDVLTLIGIIVIIILLAAVILNSKGGGGGGHHHRHHYHGPTVRIRSAPIIRPGFRPGGHHGGHIGSRPGGGFSGGRSSGGFSGGSRGSFGGGRSRGGGAGRR